MKREGLGKKLIRVFAIQVLLISLAMAAGIYVTNTIVQDSLVRRALEGEAEHYWNLYRENRAEPLPNTSNMRGYLSVAGDRAAVPDALAEYDVGLRRIAFEGSEPILYVSDHEDARLYLVFASDQVSDLAFSFGIVPLLIALLVIYLLSFLAYRLSHRAISPMMKLADFFEKYEFDSETNPALELDRLRDDADAEVASMIEAVERFSDRLQTFVERERVFTRDASHELRTPIAVFKGSLDLMARNQDRPKSDIDALKRMRRTVEDMEALIETLLLLAREDEHQLPPDPLDANELIAVYIDQLEPLARAADNTLRLHELGNLKVRVPERVLQILVINLVRNAINYTSGGTVDVFVDDSSLKVTDSGIGMRTEELENAFEPFYRGENGRGMSRGHGLGLSIVRRFARQFGWRITAQSKPGEGTTVEVGFASV